MKCGVCNSTEHSVVDTVEVTDAIRRRRKCGRCGHRWTTYERTEAARLNVEKLREHAAAIQTIIGEAG